MTDLCVLVWPQSKYIIQGDTNKCYTHANLSEKMYFCHPRTPALSCTFFNPFGDCVRPFSVITCVRNRVTHAHALIV